MFTVIRKVVPWKKRILAADRNVMRWKTKILTIGILLCILLYAFPMAAAAADSKGEWVKRKNGIYYLDAKGKKATGTQVIGGKECTFSKKSGRLLSEKLVTTKKGYCYKTDESGKIQKGFVKGKKGVRRYFDSNGVMKTGWQKIGKSYYYFSPKSGIMKNGEKVNGILLGENGKAAVLDLKKQGQEKAYKLALERLDVLTRANQVVESQTYPAMSKTEKFRAVFDWEARLPYKTLHYPFSLRDGWEYMYANDIFVQGGGTCWSSGAAFAFLADACGAVESYVCASTGHGWAEVEGKLYDPERQRWSNYGHMGKNFFAQPCFYGQAPYRVNIKYPESKKDNGAANKTSEKKKGLLKENGRLYFYGSDGQRAKNCFKKINGNRYYFGKNGAACIGLKKVENAYYYFNKKGHSQQDKTVTIKGKKHYFSKNGKAIQGVVKTGEKIWVSTATGRLTINITEYAKKGEDYDCFEKVAGKAKSSKTKDSCSGPGKDGIYAYGNFTIYTYEEDGVRTIRDVL